VDVLTQDQQAEIDKSQMVFGQALGATAADADADEDGGEGIGAGGGVGTRVVPAGKRVSIYR
jgi:ATP-dependent DNA helicase 2 subunit 1